MDIKIIAADIARDLRAHPERWGRFQQAFLDKNPTLPRCFMGHIRLRMGWYGGTEYPEVCEAIGLKPDSELCDSSRIMLWNDMQEDVGAIIAVCDRLARIRSHARPTSALVADLLAKIVGPVVNTEAKSEELSW